MRLSQQLRMRPFDETATVLQLASKASHSRKPYEREWSLSVALSHGLLT